jgi:hypothetical protein
MRGIFRSTVSFSRFSRKGTPLKPLKRLVLVFLAEVAAAWRHGSRKNCCEWFRVGEFNPKDGQARKFQDAEHLRRLDWMRKRKMDLTTRSLSACTALINKFRALRRQGKKLIRTHATRAKNLQILFGERV